MIAFDPIQHLLIDTAAEAAPLFAGGTLRFERAAIAVTGISAIAQGAFGRMPGSEVEFFACRAHVDIALRFIAKAVCTKKFGLRTTFSPVLQQGA